jgi:hypothetical protein
MSDELPKSPVSRPLFVARQTYRRRRLMDAARLLPLLGLLLWAVPLLWRNAPEDGVASSGALIYIFGVWCALVLAAALLSARLQLRDGDEQSRSDG